MAKHILKYDTLDDFKTARRNAFIVPNVSIINNTNDIRYTGAFAIKQTAEAGDIVAFNSEGKMAFIKPQYYNKVRDNWTAEAIVVVPYSHSGDGMVRCMSTKFMSCSAAGSSEGAENIQTGIFDSDGIELDPSTLPQVNVDEYRGLLCVDFANEFGTMQSSPSVYAPSSLYRDDKIIVANSSDDETAWTRRQSNDTLSPYYSDGSKNPTYFTTELIQNALRDFDGEANSAAYMTVIDYEPLHGRPTPNGIKRADSEEYAWIYPSILLPHMYSTAHLGYRQSGRYWYTPSIGELGYLVVRLKQIERAWLTILDDGSHIIPGNWHINALASSTTIELEERDKTLFAHYIKDGSDLTLQTQDCEDFDVPSGIRTSFPVLAFIKV